MTGPGSVVDGRGPALSRPRVAAGWVLALAMPPLLTVVLLAGGPEGSPAFDALAFVVVAVAAALAGGLWPALAAAVLASALLNYFFTPPLRTWSVAGATDVVTLGLFLLVALAVATVVGAAARRADQAARARREADTLGGLNETLLRGERDTGALLGLVCDTFGLDAASLLERSGDGWGVLAVTGPDPPRHPEQADAVAGASPVAVLAVRGRPLPAGDLRILDAFATHLAVVADRERLDAQTAAALRLEEGNRLRTALLAAVSHDLRTPLAGIKAAVSTLRTPGIAWSRDDETDLLAAIEDSSDRLGAIIANLLDLSRLQTGAVTLVTQEVGLDDVVARAVGGLAGAERIDLDVPAELPAVRVDVGLLERVVANLAENALRYAPAPGRVVLSAAAEPGSGCVVLKVVDHGPGVAPAERAEMFRPFQRLGDTASSGEGVGLGLAVAEGLAGALGGSLRAEETVGGGLTMVVVLPSTEGDEP